ncbi:MAG: hypothetical protein KatS3mg003_0146 [Candidatus Nitrosocaldaceae archaeon]|nr:MAG: hypothetical protein KatS3mg003_0146 [Candidatus Nitrosocaldaceae archaeon]
MPDLYFEIDLMLENLAKNYGVPNANYYFRIHKIKPSKEEYRKKVVEYMLHYNNTLESFSNMPNYDKFKEHVKNLLEEEIDKVLKGNNKDVEKRYSYYIMNEYF